MTMFRKKIAAVTLISCLLSQAVSVSVWANVEDRVISNKLSFGGRYPAKTENSFKKEKATPDNAEEEKATPSDANEEKEPPKIALFQQKFSYEKSILSYAYDNELTVNDGNGYLNASEDVNEIKDLNEFTLNLNFRTSRNGIQSLFYAGSDKADTQDQYFNLYISERGVGLEVRDGVANPGIAASASVVDGRYHALALSFKRNEYYRVYLDGQLILNHTDAADTARFLDSLDIDGGPNTMTFGKGTRVAGNNYPYTGTLNKIDLFAEALPEEEIMRMHGVIDAVQEGAAISEEELPAFTGSNSFNMSDDLGQIAALEQGSVHIRYRVSDFNNTSNGNMALFSVSDQKANGTYGIMFINPKSDQMGIYMTNGGTELLNIRADMPEDVTIKDQEWHTASFVANKRLGKYMLYMDGKLCGTGEINGFFNNLSGADTVLAGGLSTKSMKHSWALKGNVDLLEVYANPLTEKNVDSLHEMTKRVVEAELPESAVKSEPENLFYSTYDDSLGYRIPSLYTTQNGVTIAAIDKRNSHNSDYGNIDISIRRSTDSGQTWSSPKVILDLPSGGDDLAAYFIDASMVEDKQTGMLHLLVDMFPESKGLMQPGMLKPGTGYREVEGKKYLELRDYYQVNSGSNLNKPQTNQVYIVKEDGFVYLVGRDDSLTKSEYYIPDVAEGSLFKGADRTPAGNIYLYTGNDKGELTVLRASYLWMISSRDDGETWSDPVDLTPMVKEEWMLFLGTGPGVGIQIENGEHAGRLVFPVYFANRNVRGSQASAVIYSDDHGKTWQRGKSPVELRGVDNLETMNNDSLILTESQVVEVGNEGRLKIFMRNYGERVSTATSDDGGATWKNFKKDQNLFDSYCQLSIIKYQDQLEYEGVLQDAYIFSNPARGGRNDGTVRIGFYDETRDEFIWPYQQLIHKNKFQYSCLTNLPDKQIGLLYEGDVPNMRFTKFSTDWITAPRSKTVGAPSIIRIRMDQSDRKLTFTVDFDMNMLKVGTPVLNLLVDGRKAQGVYESGDSSEQYVFSYELKDKKSHRITAVNVSGGEGAFIGNFRNQLPKDVSYEFVVETDQTVSDSNTYESDNITVSQKKIPASTGNAQDWVLDEKGWKMSDGKGGVIQNAWKQVNQIWYYLGVDGYMKTGWQFLDAEWYYMDQSGAMKTGWILIGETWYYLYSDGSMAANTKIEGYYLDETGAMK